MRQSFLPLLVCIVAVSALLPALAVGADVKFATPPTVAKSSDGATISFAVSEKTDVEVAVLASNGDVVRHLAAGVLGGEKPPPAPLKAGLSQSLTWDGKDDFGKPAKNGPFKIRARAGTQFKFGRFIGEDPYTFGAVDGLSSDEDGNLYISSYAGTHNQGERTLRVYDGQGRYLRELMPFPASMKPDSMKNVARWDAGAKVWRPTNYSCLNPDFYASPGVSLVSASLSNGVYFSDREDVYAINADGSVKGAAFGTKQRPWPIFDAKNQENDHYGHPWHYHEGVECFAASPDGKWLYLTGPVPNAENRKKKEDPRFPLGGVYRMRLDGKDDMKLFVTLPATYDGNWAKDGGKNYGRSGPIHFVGCDSKNNVYVPDRQTNRVVVYSEDGKQLGEVPCKNPHQIVAHPKTGAFYVLRMVCNGWNTHAIAIEKFDGFASGAKSVAVYDKFPNKVSPRIAVTTSGGKTMIWIAGLPEGLVALEDKGSSLVLAETAFKRRPESQVDWNRLSVDYARDELYVADGGNLIWRYDGKTGDGGMLKRKNGQPLAGVDLSIGYDGLLYIRTGESFSGPLERFTKDLEPAPYPSGTNVISPQIYSRFGIGNCEKGLGCGPNGEVYISFMYDWTLYAVGGFGGDGKALKGQYLEGKFPAKGDNLKGYPPELRTSSVGPITSAGGGVRVDLQGNIYLGLDVKPAGFAMPAFLAGDEVGKRWYSSVVKFGSAGGAILGIKDSESKMTSAPKIELEGKLTAENGLNIYPGLGPISGPGPGGNSSCCVCRVPRFDVDRYGRLVMPSAFAANVLLYDNAGNKIAEIGSFGNFDSQYINVNNEAGKQKKAAITQPEIPLAWPSGVGFSENHLYLNDTYNRRVVRVDKAFSAETVSDVK